LGRLARESGELKKQRRSRRETLARDHDLGSLLYESDAMHELVTLAVKVARSDLPVLITGPNGAGKEMIADIVQRNSAVAAGPYVKVNAGALPGGVMEAELFGPGPGAPPARRRAPGLHMPA